MMISLYAKLALYENHGRSAMRMIYIPSSLDKDILVFYWKEKYNYSIRIETFESPCILCTWDGGNRFLRNASTSHPNHTAAQL